MSEVRGVRVPVRERQETPVVARSSIRRGRMPPQGAQEIPYHWDDVLDGEAPPGRGHGEGSYSLYHGTEIEGECRIYCTSLVEVTRPGPQGERIAVESRVTVQRRAFLELMDRERAFSDRLAARWREGLVRRLVAQRAAANRAGRPWLVRAAVRVIRVEARVGLGFIAGLRRLMRGAVQLPDALVSRLVQTHAQVGGRTARRSFLSGLRDPGSLSPEQKGVLLFLTLALAVSAVFLVGTFFALALPQWAGLYQRFVGDATAAFLSAVALPLPTEAFVIASTLAMGPTLAFAGSFAGKMLGVLVLYLLGDSLFDKVAAATAGKPRMARMVAWLKGNADRHGFLLLVLINGVPFVPDVLLYAFALSGMDFRRYMAGIAVGTALKFGLLIAGVLLLGPERITAFLDAPFG